jgi:hypothetical protein
MDLETFVKKFNKIKNEGYLPTLRSHNTGVGHTLEQALGLTENALALPDLGIAELKAHREDVGSMITLFTLDRGVWKMNQLDVIQLLGIDAPDGRRNFYTTLDASNKTRDLQLEVNKQTVSIKANGGLLVAEWSLEALAAQFTTKFPALIYVTASVKTGTYRGEMFWYNRAQLLSGTSTELFFECLKKGWVKLDVRMHKRDNKVRNHGTAFRINEADLPRLFKEIREL